MNTSLVKRLPKRASLKRLNAWFVELSPREQRLVIAEDVLAQLDAKRLNAQVDCYVGLDTGYRYLGRDLQPIFRRLETCRVCALGALFVTRVQNYNDFQLSASESNLRGSPKASRWALACFSSLQLDCIENAFEQRRLHVGTENSQLHLRAAGMYSGMLEPEERLRAIMQNILDNDGRFVVPE